MTDTTGQISDGYHTFDELYDHRYTLYVALMLSHPELSWRTLLHDDGTSFDGWFVAGMSLPTGDVSYHLPMSFWDKLSVVETRERVLEFDGYTSQDVVKRISQWSLGSLTMKDDR